MYQSTFVKIGCGNQNSNTGRYESFFSRQKWRESCPPHHARQNYYERFSACFSKVCIIALLLLEGSWELKLDYRSSTSLFTLSRSGELFILIASSHYERLSANQPELTAVAVLPYICKGSLYQSREFCRRTLAFQLSSDLLNLWTTSFPSQRPPYLCCWIVELYIYRIPCKDYGKSCVWQTLRTNNTGSLDQGTSVISCDGQHYIQCSGRALLVTIPSCDARRHNCSTNITIGFSTESWNLGSSTSPCPHESWERISTRTILYATRNHTPPSPTHDAETCWSHLSMMTSDQNWVLSMTSVKFGLYISKAILKFYLYHPEENIDNNNSWKVGIKN